VTYLLDNSTWARATHDPVVASRLADHIRSGELALCTITALEVLYSARNADEYQRDLARLRQLPWYDLSDARAAVELQLQFALRGWHRTPLPDVLIAATAAEHGLVVLHHDRDYERLAETAGIRHEWLPAPR
jgi:predicted nucleic acid-binding protein